MDWDNKHNLSYQCRAMLRTKNILFSCTRHYDLEGLSFSGKHRDLLHGVDYEKEFRMAQYYCSIALVFRIRGCTYWELDPLSALLLRASARM